MDTWVTGHTVTYTHDPLQVWLPMHTPSQDAKIQFICFKVGSRILKNGFNNNLGLKWLPVATT